MSTTFIQYAATELPPPPPYSVHDSSIETYEPITSASYEKLGNMGQIDYPYPPAIEFAEKKLRIASNEDPLPWEDKVAELDDIIGSLQSELDGTRQFIGELQQRLDVLENTNQVLINGLKDIVANEDSVIPSTSTNQSFQTEAELEIDIEIDSRDDHYDRLCSSLQQLIDEAESCLSVSSNDPCFTNSARTSPPASLTLVSAPASPKYNALATETIITMDDLEDNSEKKDVKVWSRRHQPSRTRTHTRIRSLRRLSRSSNPARLRSRRVGTLSPSLRSLPTTPTTSSPPPCVVSSTLREQYARYLVSQENLVRQFDDLMNLAAESEAADVPAHVVENIVMVSQTFNEPETQSKEDGSWWPIETVNFFSPSMTPTEPVLEVPALEPITIIESKKRNDGIIRFMSTSVYTGCLPSPFFFTLILFANLTHLILNSRLHRHVALDLDPLFSNPVLDFTLITYTVLPLFIMWSGVRSSFVSHFRWIRLLDEALYVVRIISLWAVRKMGPRWVRKSVLARMRASGSV